MIENMNQGKDLLEVEDVYLSCHTMGLCGIASFLAGFCSSQGCVDDGGETECPLWIQLHE